MCTDTATVHIFYGKEANVVIKDNPNLRNGKYGIIGNKSYTWLYKNNNERFKNVIPKKTR